MYQLTPFITPKTPNCPQISSSVEISKDSWTINWQIENQSNLPKTINVGKRKDELWKGMCLEAFFRPKGKEEYFELNVNLRGDWNLYHFSSYRQNMDRAENALLLDLAIISRLPWILQAHVKLPSSPTGWDVGVSAIMRNPDLYFALAHPEETGPDFHHPTGFIYGEITKTDFLIQ